MSGDARHSGRHRSRWAARRTKPGRFDTEGPQHDVTVSAFALGKYNVTTEEFLLFLKDTGYRPEPCNPILNLGWRSPGGGLAYPPLCRTAGALARRVLGLGETRKPMSRG